MNIQMVEGINKNIDEIIERWEERMKDEKGEKFFHFMPDRPCRKNESGIC